MSADVVTFPSQGDDLALEPEPMTGDELQLELEPELALDLEPDAPVATPVEVVVSPALVEVLPADFPLPVLTKFIPNPALRTAVQEAAQQALATEVVGTEGLQRADEAVARVRARIKAIEDHFADPTKVAYDLHRRLTGLRAEWQADGVAAITTVSGRIVAESDRLDALAREEARRQQEAADRQAREAAAREAQEAAAAQAPPEVVQELQQTAQTATAPPVTRQAPASSVMRSTTTTKTWKARIVGTPGTDDPNPSIVDVTPQQRAKVLELLKAIVEGRAPLAAVDLNWSYLNKRASADKSAMGIPGIEAFQVGGTRSKPGRS